MFKQLKTPKGTYYLDESFYNENVMGLGCGCLCVSGLVKPTVRFAQSNGMQSYGVYPDEQEELIRLNGGRDGIFSATRDYMALANVLVIMSGIGNTEKGIPDATSHFHGPWSVGGFAQWLRDNGECIISTPWLSNPMHQKSGFSLRRGWFWLTKKTGATHIAGTADSANIEAWEQATAFPFADWKRYYKQQANIGAAATLKDFELKELHG